MKVSTSVIRVLPGFYLLRHPGGVVPPMAVTRAPGSEGECETLTAREDGALVLDDASDCIVLRVRRAPATFLIAAFQLDGPPVAPVVRIDRITLEAAPQPPTPARPPSLSKQKASAKSRRSRHATTTG